MLLNPFRFAVAGGGSGYRYWRLQVTKFAMAGVDYTDNTGLFSLQEFSVYEASNARHPASAMTSNSAPSPLTASASSNDSSYGEIWKAFDQDLNDATGGWTPLFSSDTGPWWVQIDLGSGNSVDATYCKIAPDTYVNDGGTGQYCIRSFEVLASTTGAFTGEQVTKFTVTDLAVTGWTAGTNRVFTF